MTDVFPGEEEDDLFSDILGMIADALEGLGDEDQLDVGGGYLGGVSSLTEEFLVVLTIQGVDLSVTLQDQTGLGDVAFRRRR